MNEVNTQLPRSATELQKTIWYYETFIWQNREILSPESLAFTVFIKVIIVSTMMLSLLALRQ